ncbi:MAG: IPT/TIG domain-containing protein [Patescibacteria group bacterium]
MQNQKKPKSKLKSFLGGLASVGIFLSFFAFKGGVFAPKNLGADLNETTPAETVAVTPAITAIDPASGKVGDTISITVTNFSDLTRGTGGIFFGDIPAEIETVDQAADGTTMTIFTKVPDITALGEYEIKVTTPTTMTTSPTKFQVTALSDLAPAPTPTTADTTTPTTEPATTTESTQAPTPDLSTAPTSNGGQLENQTPPPSDNLATVTQNPEPSLPAPTTNVFATPPVFAGEPPANLTATPLSAGIALAWDAPETEVDHFNIYYGTKSGKYIHRVPATGTFTLLNSNFVNGTKYFFMISAVATDGTESQGSNEAASIYSPTAPQTIGTLHSASEKPEKLSEQGPAETLAVSIFVALVASGIIFRRKIFARN